MSDNGYKVYASEQFVEDKLNGLNTGGTQPDWNQNDEIAVDYIKNKPFYVKEDEEILKWNGDIEGLEATSNNFYWVSPIIVDERILDKYYFKLVSESEYSSCMENMHPVEDFYVGSYFAFVFKDNSSGSYMDKTYTFPKAGIYLHSINGNSIHVKSIIIKGEIKQLDEKFIPDTIARTQYVDENFALKSDLENIDLSDYETVENAKLKYDELTSGKANTAHIHIWNDLTDKPFGEEAATEVILEETSKEHELISEQVYGTSVADKIVVGEEYIITYDGAKYHCAAYELCDSFGDIYNALGDSRLYIEEINDDGEKIGNDSHPEDVPFNIAYSIDDDGGSGFFWFHNFFMSYSDTGTHTIKIEKLTGETQIKTLDEKYIPDTIARISDLESIDIPTVDLELYETKEDAQLKYDTIVDAKADWNQNDESALDYIKNKPFDEKVTTEEMIYEQQFVCYGYEQFLDPEDLWNNLQIGVSYIITLDGVTYKCTPWIENDMVIFIGDSRLYTHSEELHNKNPEDVPFLICCNETEDDYMNPTGHDWTIWLKDGVEGSTHTIKVEAESGIEIKTLDEKYIPDTIARTSDLEANYALKSDLENIDLSDYETKSDSKTKYDNAIAYTDTAVSGKADAIHSHDDIYYTETEIDTKLDNKSDTSHNHDSDYDAKGSASAVQTNLNTVSDALDSHIDNSKVHVTETEKSTWNSKSNFSGSYNDLTDKPTISASAIGLGNVDNTSDEDKPVSTAQQAAIDTALTNAKSYTDTKTNGMATTTVVDNKISTHNTNTEAHSDIRDLIIGLTTRLNALANSTDVELDQMAELVTYIKENRNLIEGITTNKVNVSDIVNNLTTNVSNKPLSAAQGVAIKGLIDDLQEVVDSKVNSVSLVSGTKNGTLKLTVNGTATDNIAVKGLGSAAYTASTAYATSNHNHDDVYSKTSHSHNDNYYTKIENDNLLDGKSNKTHIHGISDITDLQDSLNSKANQTSLDGHDNNTTKHITSTERTNWNAAKTHADSDHDKYINQNAFSNVKVGSTTIVADSKTDTLELIGSNVTITPDAINDKVTIAVADGTTSVKGLVQLTNSTSSTSTTTAATPNSVKSAYDLANQAKTAATNAQTTADGKADVNHIQSIDKGGTGCTSITDTTYTTARYRASSLHSTETNPSVNGVIAWTYE